MKKKLIKILCLALCLGVFIGLAYLIIFSDKQKKQMLCQECYVNIERKGGVCLQEQDIFDCMSVSGIIWEKKSLGDMNISLIEHTIKENPYVEDVQVYFTSDAALKIYVKQRQPYIRIYAPSSFYLDENGVKMPVSTIYPLRLRVCSIEKKPDSVLINMILNMEKHIRKDSLLDALIEQIYIDRKERIELSPKMGQQRIILGTAERIEEKLEYLNLFYRKGMPHCGWDKYKAINIEYKGQIVCTKK